MNIWELDGKNGMNVPMPHVGIVAKYKLCKGEQNNETTKTNHSYNVDKVKAFVVTVSKYPGDATLTSGRYVVDAKSIMGIFSLALNKPVAFSYEGEMAAELAKEVQVYESQEV